MKSPFRYSPLTRSAKKLYRKFSPVPKSPWTMGAVQDICAVHLVPPETLVGFFGSAIEKLREIKGEDIGDYLEFGVFNGSSIGSMYKAAHNANESNMRLFGFDAFEGLPEAAENEDDGVWKQGFYACSFNDMKACLNRREVNPDDITWVNGWYKDTLGPNTAAQYDIDNIGIVFIDCDTYSSSKSVLDFLAPLIKKPAIFCFDDWMLNDLDVKGMGEYKSFNEFLETNTHLEAIEIDSYNRKSKAFIVRPK